MAIERLGSGDLLMLRAGEMWPQHVGALVLLDGPSGASDQPLDLEAVQATVAGRLHLVPRFRQVLRTPRLGLGSPYWADAPTFDIRNHVRAIAVPSPGGTAEFLSTIEGLRRRRLDLSRPPWEMWLVTGLPDSGAAVFVRLHHAVADGNAAMALLSVFLDPDIKSRGSDGSLDRPSPWRSAPPPSTIALLGDHLGRWTRRIGSVASAILRPRATLHSIRDAAPGLRELFAEAPATLTSLNRLVGPEQRLAVVSASAADIRAIGRVHRATPNDVLLALAAGGVRAELLARGEDVDRTTIRVYVPVSLRRGRARQIGRPTGNRVGQMSVPVSLSGSPSARLRRISAATARRRRRPRTSLGVWFAAGPANRWLLRVIARQRVNSTIANLPGPRNSQLAFGHRVRSIVPIVPLIGNVTLGVGAVSYGGRLDIGITADRTAYPNIDAVIDGMRAELAELAALCQPNVSESPPVKVNVSTLLPTAKVAV